jgi:UDP-N-acetylglucosamine pyrophosphorylase
LTNNLWWSAGGVLGEKVLGKVFQEFAMKGQGRFLRFWKSMTNEERDKLKRDFERIDLTELSKIYLKCRSNSEGAIDPSSLEPLPSHTWVKLYESDPLEVATWKDIGMVALNEGKIAVVLMAGGQATRLGMTMPKGFLDLNLPSHKTLYQLHAEKVLRLQDEVKHRFGKSGAEVQIPFYVMTSPEALQQTHQFFIKHQFFGLSHKQVFFFKQRSLPCVAPSGEIIMDTKCSVVFSPDGHGGLFVALKDAKAYEVRVQPTARQHMLALTCSAGSVTGHEATRGGVRLCLRRRQSALRSGRPSLYGLLHPAQRQDGLQGRQPTRFVPLSLSCPARSSPSRKS